MALVKDGSNLNFIRNEDIPQNGKKFKIIKVEKKPHFDAYKQQNIERYFITLDNNKIFIIQNDTNLARLLWNFDTVESSLNQDITLYLTEIEVKDKKLKTIRIRYNVLEKIKKELGEN